MSDDSVPPKYEVGYCKPPKHTQFQKGQSGNTRGRPKKPKALRKTLKYELSQETLKNTFLEEASRMVSINTANGEESIPIARAVIRALGVKAAKGHVHAQRLFSQTLISIEAERRQQSEESMGQIIDYKKHWTEVLDRRAYLGLPLDPPVPHPDDIIYNMRLGIVEVRGPLTEAERDKQEHYRELLTEYSDAAERYETLLAKPLENEIERSQYEFAREQLAQCRKLIPMLLELIGELEGEPVYETRKRTRRLSESK